MKCLWLDEGALSLRDDLPAPIPRDGEALISLRLAGVCATDLELRRGYYPFRGVPGHEFVGNVLSAPSAPEWEGKRVVSEINAPCHDCPTCRAGRGKHCPNRTVLGIVGRNGAFAELFVVPIENLHEVPASVDDEAAVFCEPLAAALEINEQVHFKPSDRVLLIGAGRLGLLLAKVLSLLGVELSVLVRDERKLGFFEGRGVRPLFPFEVMSAEPFEVVIEASGSPDGWKIARQSVRPGGTILLKSTYAGKLEIDASALVVDEITVIGSRCGPFAPALRLLEQGLVDPKPLIEATYSLAEGLEAFAHAERPGALKVLISNGDAHES